MGRGSERGVKGRDVGKASALGVEIGVWGREGMGGVSVCGGGGGREG